MDAPVSGSAGLEAEEVDIYKVPLRGSGCQFSDAIRQGKVPRLFARITAARGG